VHDVVAAARGEGENPTVPAQAFFTTIAGLSVSLAGFASLIAWLRTDPTTWDPINLWRVQTIVRHALTIAFLALVHVPLRELTGDDAATIRIGAGLLALFNLSDMVRYRHRDPDIWTSNSWGVFMATNGSLVLFQVVNVGVASTGMLELGFLILLTSPAAIFYNFVRELGMQASGDPARDA
jgi:hypothetical protein